MPRRLVETQKVDLGSFIVGRARADPDDPARTASCAFILWGMTPNHLRSGPYNHVFTWRTGLWSIIAGFAAIVCMGVLASQAGDGIGQFTGFAMERELRANTSADSKIGLGRGSGAPEYGSSSDIHCILVIGVPWQVATNPTVPSSGFVRASIVDRAPANRPALQRAHQTPRRALRAGRPAWRSPLGLLRKCDRPVPRGDV